MSAAESVEQRRERLRAGVTALRQRIAECSGRMETLRSSRAKPARVPQWESSDSDAEAEGEHALEEAERTREAVLALRTRLLATRELCALTVEHSETLDLPGRPPDLAREVSAAAEAAPGARWRQVTARCRFQSVPFEMAFLVLENDKGVLAYRNLRADATKPRQRLELASSALGSCATPGDAADCLRSYSAAWRVRRDTLQALADLYEQIEIRLSDEGGGYRLTCFDVLVVEWRLQCAASPLLPFRHRILLELEYVTDERYLEDIKKIHIQLKEPEIAKTERTRLFRKLIEISLQMYEDHKVTETTEFDAETARMLNTSRRMTLDHHNDGIDDETTRRNIVKGKRDQYKNSKTKPTDPKMVRENTSKSNNDVDMHTKNQQEKERTEQGVSRMNIEKNKNKKHVDKLIEEVEIIQINNENCKQNDRREEMCEDDEHENIFEMRNPKNVITKKKSQVTSKKGIQEDNASKVSKDVDMNTKDQKIKERPEQGTSRINIEKDKRRKHVDKLTDQVEKIDINGEISIKNAQRKDMCEDDEQENIFEMRDPKNKMTKKKSQSKPKGGAQHKKDIVNNENAERPNHDIVNNENAERPNHDYIIAEDVERIGRSKDDKKKPQATKEKKSEENVRKIQNKKHCENENNLIKASKKVLNKVHNEGIIRQNNVQKGSEKIIEEVLPRKSSKNKIIDKENVLLNSSREIITGMTKNASRHSVRDNLYDRNVERETLSDKISETESKSSRYSVPKQISSKNFLTKQKSGKKYVPEKETNKASISGKISTNYGIEVPEKIPSKSSFPGKISCKKSVREEIKSNAFEEQVSEITSTQEKISEKIALPQKKSKGNIARESKTADVVLPCILGRNAATEKIIRKNVVGEKTSNKNPMKESTSSENDLRDKIPKKMVMKETKVNTNVAREKVLSKNSPKKKIITQINEKTKQAQDKISSNKVTDILKLGPKVDGVTSNNPTKINSQGAKNLKRVKSAESVVNSKKLKKAESDRNPSVIPEKGKMSKPTDKVRVGSAIPKINRQIARTGSLEADKRKMVTGQEKVPTKIPKKVSTFFFGHQVPSRQSPRTAKKPFSVMQKPFFTNRV